LWGLFVFSPRGLRMRTLFDGRSRAAACPGAQRPSHPLRRRRSVHPIRQAKSHARARSAYPTLFAIQPIRRPRFLLS
jgi:hypothetical protein